MALTLQVSQFSATFCAVIFAGAAIYIKIAEHPARMLGDTRTAAAQWAASYKRATFMQALLALISLIAGIAAWFFGASLWGLVAGLLVAAVLPFTFIVTSPRTIGCSLLIAISRRPGHAVC